MKKQLFTSIEDHNHMCNKIDEIGDVYSHIEISNIKVPFRNNKIISIIRNSSLAGSIHLLDSTDFIINTNSYYIVIDETKYKTEYIYYYMEFINKDIIELSKLTLKPTLSKDNIINIIIDNISQVVQTEIVEYCKFFDNSINKLKHENETIKNKDIFSLMSKVHNF